MRATVLTAGPGPAADAANRLAAALGDTPDLVVVGTAVSGGAPDPAVVAGLERTDLSDTVVFLVSVGHWPAERETADRALRPLVTAAGGRVPAPTLHLLGDDPIAVAAFARYWRPVACEWRPVAVESSRR